MRVAVLLAAWAPVWTLAAWALAQTASFGSDTFALACLATWGVAGLCAGACAGPAPAPPDAALRLVLYAPLACFGHWLPAQAALQCGACMYTLLALTDPVSARTPQTHAEKAAHHAATLFLLATVGGPDTDEATKLVGARILWAYTLSSWCLALHQVVERLPAAGHVARCATGTLVALSWAVVRMPVTLAATLTSAAAGQASQAQTSFLFLLNAMNLYWFGKILARVGTAANRQLALPRRRADETG